MDERFYEMIYKRKSFHLFRKVGDDKISKEELKDIEKAYQTFIPLDAGIQTCIRIVPGDQTNCRRGEEYCILFYSEKKDGYLQNIGYLGEQMDLYLVSKNIGTLWFGIGKTEESSFRGMEYVIMMAIHKISDDTKFRRNMFKSKRKPIAEIWEGDVLEGVTDIVRFAPSACNSQPWLVKNDEVLSVYRYKKPGKRGIMPATKVTFYNRIDLGVFLCMLELCFKHCRIHYERKLFHDSGDEELTLNAVYTLKADNPPVS